MAALQSSLLRVAPACGSSRNRIVARSNDGYKLGVTTLKDGVIAKFFIPYATAPGEVIQLVKVQDEAAGTPQVALVGNNGTILASSIDAVPEGTTLMLPEASSGNGGNRGVLSGSAATIAMPPPSTEAAKENGFGNTLVYAAVLVLAGWALYNAGENAARLEATRVVPASTRSIRRLPRPIPLAPAPAPAVEAVEAEDEVSSPGGGESPNVVAATRFDSSRNTPAPPPVRTRVYPPPTPPAFLPDCYVNMC